ncbi:MAG: glycosyltransferase family 2 protein [Candidatus Magasanikbacteria bacterium]
MKLSVHLVTWNGGKYIPYLFDSLRKQTFKDWRLIILDNASTDDTLREIKTEISTFAKATADKKNFPVEVELIENKENKGFAGGHNQLFRGTGNKDQGVGEYVLLLNQDMYLMPDCLEKMVKFMDTHEDVAVVSPRLMRWDFGKCRIENAERRIEDSLSNNIDALGLKIFRNRRVIEKYTGKDWSVLEPKMKMSYRAERFNGDGTALEVFGVSGAFPLYRRAAIEAVKFGDGSFLDESYHSYKEDVDLAFRLQSAGFKSYVLLDTVAYHDRSAAGPQEMGDSAAVENKKKQSEWVKYHSYKNHLMTLYKNEYWQNWLLDAVFIKWYELKKFVWFLLFDRAVLRGWAEIWKNRKDLKIKRLKIKSLRKVGWREIRKWWR